MNALTSYFYKKISLFSALSRFQKSLLMILIDSIFAILIIFLAFSLRLGFWYFPEKTAIYKFEYWTIFLSPLFLIPVFYIFGLYKSIIQFIGLKGFLSIAKAVALYSSIWGLFIFMLNIGGVPRSVILINWMLGTIVFIGVRILARWFLYGQRNGAQNKHNIIIYGANSSGTEIAQSLQLSNDFNHIAYVDDDNSLIGSYINGIEVFDSKIIAKLIDSFQVKEIFVVLPEISRYERQQIIQELSSFEVIVKNLPSISLLAKGKLKTEDLHQIDINDLLGRKLAKTNSNLLKKNITNKNVLVTGAGGSIGAELCEQILKLKPSQLILFDLSESSLYLIEQKLISLNVSDIEIVSIIGSIRDKNRLRSVFNNFDIQTIYHAAAYKHVPLVESNQSEGVFNNSLGTLILAQEAISFNVEIFVLISTDKAVRPTNVMGATKRIAELILQALSAEHTKTCFTMVRFGNVLDSSGSVIPLFKSQIKAGGPITVTAKDVQRYFMTIPEAVELVIQAGSMAKGGDVFVLDMGNPVMIKDLATKMIQLSGLQIKDDKNPNGDIEIIYTGLRPGEKLFEELLIGDNVSKTENALIMSAQEEMIEWRLLEDLLMELEEACKNSNQKQIRKIISKIVPEFNFQN